MASNLKKEVEKKEENLEALDWIILRNEMESGIDRETWTGKLKRKMNENPFVPIGCGATVLALCFGLWNFKTGNRAMSQQMMRARVLAQGLTFTALIVGVFMGTTKIG